MAGVGWLPSPMASRAVDLEDAWSDRLVDAKALLAASRQAASIASGLYAVEICLKALICRRLDVEYLPRAVQFHSPEELLVLSGLSRRIDDPTLAPVRANWSRILKIADDLNNLRYKPDRGWSIADATSSLRLLEDPMSGVLTWLSAML